MAAAVFIGLALLAMLGALLYPALMHDGYPERFSLGLVTSSGSLGLLFPPSVPLILPVAVSYGVNPVHHGIVFLANMQIGYFTPPVVMNLFIASYRFEKPVATL